MARTMSDEERRQFLSEGTRTGKLSITDESGAPHVTPIWFVLDGDDVVFNTGASSVKGQAFERDRRAAICVDSEEPPYAFVMMQGTVEISRDVDDMLPWATKIGGRYMGADRAEEFGRRNAVAGELLVRLAPSTIVARAGVAD